MRGLDLNQTAFILPVITMPANPVVVNSDSRYDQHQQLKFIGVLYQGVYMCNTPATAVTPDLPYKWLWGVVGNSLLAGWRLDRVLPVLLTQSFSHGVKPPDSFMVDPLKPAWGPDVLKVDQIYMQGRRDYDNLPPIQEVCQYLGVATNAVDLPPESVLASYSLQDWKAGGKDHVEALLRMQYILVKAYYGYA